MTDGTASTTTPSETPIEAPAVPFLFGCALWVPTFAVLLYFFMWFLRPRLTVGPPESLPDDS